ncbi:carcinoembryonic antigen-related cell adhesion molecule 8-like [Hemibagrus wyckioides]|uniref:carcinoembryonic antigen-related cell adhesion molecule 8-like n=1 Tax=Hemibagrus wyckioides TaxID=337641 RepID=UPI00266DABAE|nr:carcinoembryonic antigen-related cell adhesion molecule 8-like [Hemibagrus wyckioides]
MDLHAVCCNLLLLTCSGLGFGQQLILPERINKAVGENVVITPIRLPDLPHYLIRWEFNTTSIVVGTDVLPPYTDRVSIDTTTLALEIRNLTENDTGPYILTINTATTVVTGQTSLQVLVPVSSVTIVPSQTELVEFNSTVSFVCSASGSFLSFIWLNGSSEITAGERVQLTDNNSSLTITSVIRGDTGPYECEASNSISRKKSLPLSLIIYYGPEYVNASADPVGPFYSSGSNLILTCSAVSSPAAEFQWAVNGTELGEMGRELNLSNIQISQSGNYTCIAHNKQSLRYSVSQPISITVLDKGNAGGDSLSAGAIAGIVIGVLLGVAGIAGLIFYFVKVKEMPKTNSRGNNQSGATHNAGGHDSFYENMVSFQNQNPGVNVGGSDPHPVKASYYENTVGFQNKNPVMNQTPHSVNEGIYENP